MSDHKDSVSLFSHIFKTPLTSIKAASDLLNKHLAESLSAKDKNILDMVVRNSRTLEMRINSLLELMIAEEKGIKLDVNIDQLEEIHSLKYEMEEEKQEEKPKEEPKKGRTILVADDTEDIRMLVAGALKDEGYHVEEAKNGEIAWYVIKNYRPDVLVLDGLMPKRDGFSLARDAKDMDPERYKPRIILMTAVYKKQHYQSEAKNKYGVDEYMVKPFEIGELVANVKKLLGEM